MSAVDDLIAHLARLPGIGERTATRLAFHLLRSKPQFRDGLSLALNRLSQVHLCSVCCTVTEHDPCSICSSPLRQKHLLCLVEKPSDIYSIERLHSYHGSYHVLHGVLSPVDGVTPSDLRLPQLFDRLESGAISEIILALSPTVEGDATCSYIVKQLSGKNILVTRLASGLPMGSDLEFADQITLGKAFEARTRVG